MKKQILKSTFFVLAILVSTISIGQTASAPTFIPTKQAMENTPSLQGLLYDSQPEIYLTQGGNISKYGGDTPLVANCSASEVAHLYETNPDYTSIKVIKIRIEKSQDLVVLDISRLSDFQNLEYIQLIFEYSICGGSYTDESCLLAKTQPMIIGEKSIKVLYQLSIPQ